MPTEIRHIMFTAAETVLAISAFQRSRGQALPFGRVSAAEPVEVPSGEMLRYRIEIAPDEARNHGGEGQAFELIVEGPELAAAFIAYCHNNSVPIPIRGTKTLQRFGSQIGLIITLGGRGEQLRAKLLAPQAREMQAGEMRV